MTRVLNIFLKELLSIWIIILKWRSWERTSKD